MARWQGKNNVSEAIYLFAFSMLCLKYIFFFSRIASATKAMDNLFTMLVLGCMAVKLLMQDYTAKSLLLTAALAVVIIYSCMYAGNTVYMLSFLCVIAIQDVDIVKALKLSCYIKVSAIVIHVFWYIIIYNTNPSVIEYVYRNGVKRHFFFLGHANAFGALLIWTLLEIIYICYSKLKPFHLLLMWVVSFVFYRFTYSNSGIIVLSLVILLILLDKHSSRACSKIVTIPAKYGHAVCSVLFPMLVMLYPGLSGQSKQLWDTLDGFFTGRMLPGAYAYDTYGFTFLGRALKFPAKAHWRGTWFDELTYFDNYFIGQFILFGIIHLIIVSLALFLLTDRMENKEKIIIAAFIFYGVMESYAPNVAICYALLIVGKSAYQRKQQAARCDASSTTNLDAQEGVIPLWKRRRSVS